MIKVNNFNKLKVKNNKSKITHFRGTYQYGGGGDDNALELLKMELSELLQPL